MYVSIRFIDHLKKAIYPVGPKKCLWCIVWSRDPCPLIRFANGMTPRCKVRFMRRIYKTSMCPTCLGSKRYLSDKKTVGWSSGKGGRTSTIVGLPAETSRPFDRPRKRKRQAHPKDDDATKLIARHDVRPQLFVLRDVDESC